MCQYDDIFCHLTAVLSFFIALVMGIRRNFGPLIVILGLLRDIYKYFIIIIAICFRGITRLLLGRASLSERITSRKDGFNTLENLLGIY